MSIQWADDFSRYGVGDAGRLNMLDGLPYAIISDGGPTTDPDATLPAGSRCFKVGRSNGNGWFNDNRTALPSPTTGVLGVVARFWLPTLPNSSVNRPTLFALGTVDGSIIVRIIVQQTGAIIAVNSAGTTLTDGDTLSPVISPSSWNHFELKYNNATGAGELYVNGVLRLNFTGGPVSQTAAIVYHSPRSDTVSAHSLLFMKDYIIWDGTGSQNNNIFGTVVVARYSPNADIALGGWVPSTGATGFNLLNKTTPDDTTYLSADDAPPAAMRYGFPNLPSDVTSVRGVISVVRARKVDGGDAKLQVGLTPNATDYDNGQDRPITSSFTYWFDVSELSPVSAAPWTPVDIDNLEAKIDRTI